MDSTETDRRTVERHRLPLNGGAEINRLRIYSIFSETDLERYDRKAKFTRRVRLRSVERNVFARAPSVAYPPPTGLLRAGYLWTVVGGGIVLLFGLLWLALSLYLAPKQPDLLGADNLGQGIASTGIGVLIIALGRSMYTRPGQHRLEGGLVLVAAIASLDFGFAGGFFIGCLVSLAGGIAGILGAAPQPLVVAVNPMGPPPPPGVGAIPLPTTRFCPTCGRQNPIEVPVCPQCGTRFL